MTRFALTVIDDDRVVLSTEEVLSRDQYELAQLAWEQWKRSGGALVVADCVVRDLRGVTIELDLGRPT